MNGNIAKVSWALPLGLRLLSVNEDGTTGAACIGLSSQFVNVRDMQS
jgi:hypothetical protein